MTHRSAHASLVAGAALLIGLAEAVLIAGSWAGARAAFQYVPPRMWLVVPLCWLIAGAALMLLFLPVARRHASLVTVLLLVVLFTFGRRSDWIAALVAIVMCVVAVLIARWWLRRPRVIAAWIAAGIALLLIAGVALPRRTDISPRAFDASAPNVLIVFLDTVSKDDPLPPALARLARQSVVFDRAYSTSSWTLPAHLSAITGLPAHRLGVDLHHQQYQQPALTLAERFRRRGYRTAAVVSNSFLNRGSGFQRGFDSFEQSENALDVCRTAMGRLADRHLPWFAATVCNWSASEVTRRALRHIDDSEQPLFLVLNYMDAHEPYYVERDCRPPGFEVPWPREVPTSEYRTRYYESHMNALRCIDRHLGPLLDRFDIVAVLADHGEHFGDHGLVRHGNSLYAQLLHVPMMIRTPRSTPRHVSEPVSIAILPQLVEGTESDRTTSIISHLSNAEWSIVRDRWHLISMNGREELYDLVADPRELQLLDQAPVLDELRDELKRQQPLLDDETRSRFRSLGYVR